MGGDIPVASGSGIVPARSIGGVQAMPLFPGGLELAFARIDGEVHVAKVVGLSAGKRAQEDNAEERRTRCGLGKLQDARPLTQTLGCASLRPAVKASHRPIFAESSGSRTAVV
jgi:hypothetical protein